MAVRLTQIPSNSLLTYRSGGRENISEITNPLPISYLSQLPENQFKPSKDAISVFRMKLADVTNPSTADSRRKALNAFLSYLGPLHPKINELDDTLLDGWTVWMIQNGYTRNTAAQYLKQLSALYGKAVIDGLAPASDAIGRARSRLLAIPETDFRPLPPDLLPHLQKLFRPGAPKIYTIQSTSASTSDTIPSSLQLSKDIVTFAILNGGMTFKEIAKYRKTDYKGDNPILKEIVQRNIRARNKYLFNLDQADKTPKQLAADLRKHFFLILTPLGIPLSEDTPVPSPSKGKKSKPHSDASKTAFDLWCYTALQSGLTPQQLIAFTKGNLPTFNPALRLLTPSGEVKVGSPANPSCNPTQEEGNLSLGERASVSNALVSMPNSERERILSKVANVLTDNPLNWYAMQFRPFVDFDKVKAAMDLCRNEVTFETLYYPSEEIRKRVGKKLLKEQRPVMPGLLFFRAKATDILPMFRNIGHLAWCYRRTATPGSPYAVIPTPEMRRYQTIIGQFTPDLEIKPQGTIEIGKNDTVILLTGNLAGREAKVLDIKPKPGGKTIVRLSLIGDNNIEWQLTAPPAALQKKQ